MKCKCLDLKILSAYIDDELDEKTKKSISKHIKDCIECKKRINELKSIDKLIKNFKIETPSNYFQLGLKTRIIEKVKKKRKFFALRTVIIYASFLLLIFSSSLFVYFKNKFQPPIVEEKKEEFIHKSLIDSIKKESDTIDTIKIKSIEVKKKDKYKEK